MKIYTIGFAQKRAEVFFGLLLDHGVQRLVDIRLNPNGQLAGYAKRDDLPYFLSRLATGCQYVYMPELAPTKEIISAYRSDSDWRRYQARYEALMDERRIPEVLERSEFARFISCFLCSEPSAEKCHRRLVSARIAACWPSVEVIHL